MIWQDVLVRRARDAGEIARGLAVAFEIDVGRVKVRPIEDEFPDPAGASVVCLVFERAGGFRTALSIYTYFDTARLDATSVLRRLSRSLDSEILTSDDDVDPYALIQIAPGGETSKVDLDAFLLDEKDGFHVRPAAFDHYAAVRDLADRLDAEGRGDWAGKLRDVVADGSTGAEIFMGLRWLLRRLKDDRGPLSSEAEGMADDLLKRSDDALGQ